MWLPEIFCLLQVFNICVCSSLTAEIVMFDGQIVVYKFIQDLHFFVTGGEEENELILASVLQGFSDAVDRLLKLFSLY